MTLRTKLEYAIVIAACLLLFAVGWNFFLLTLDMLKEAPSR